MKSPSKSVRSLREEVFSRHWDLDNQIIRLAAEIPSHGFLHNPAGHYAYIYLCQSVKAVAEQQTGRPFSDLTVLDWGCGKGHVSKMIRDLGPRSLDSCDLRAEKEDSAFGQDTPILQSFGIQVRSLEHAYKLPYPDEAFDIVLSFGVLEHVADDDRSLGEIRRVLRPGGLFFCFYLPTRFSWTQAVARIRGDEYHDRLYTRGSVSKLLERHSMKMLDLWYRQMFPKNSIRYPNFRAFERLDQFVTRNTPLRHFATNIEFVAQRPE